MEDLFEDADGEELEEIDVDTIGLVPEGANKRTFILLKGGDTVDIEEVVGQVMEDPRFFSKLVEAFTQTTEEEKQGGKPKAAVEMALKILGAHKENLPEGVQKAIETLAGFVGKAEPKDEDEDEMEERKADAPKDEEEEEEEEKGRHKDEDEDEYPTPKTKEALPEGFADLLSAAAARAEAAEKTAREAMKQLEQTRRERRLDELASIAESYSALPGVKPDEMAEWLLRLEEREPDAFKYLTDSILGPAALATVELYGEVGTGRSDAGERHPFLAQVEARAKELEAKHPDWTPQQAYAEAYTQIGDENPSQAWAYSVASRT